MDTTGTSQIVLDLSSSFGAVVICAFIVLILYGVTCMQTFIYYLKYPDDPLRIKVLVVFLVAMNTFHAALVCAGVWVYLVERFGDIENLHRLHLPLMLQTVVTSTVAFVVQGFFTHRIWIFSNKKIIFPLILIPPNMAQLGLTITYFIKGIQWGTDEGLLRLANIAYAITGISAGADALIAGIMITLLAIGRTSGFYKATDRMIMRLVIITLNTGLWTAAVALLVIVTLLAVPKSMVYWGIYVLLCSLYTNTVLATLNVRALLRKPLFDSRMSYQLGKTQSNFKIRVDTSSSRHTESSLATELFTKNSPEAAGFEDKSHDNA